MWICAIWQPIHIEGIALVPFCYLDIPVWFIFHSENLCYPTVNLYWDWEHCPGTILIASSLGGGVFSCYFLPLIAMHFNAFCISNFFFFAFHFNNNAYITNIRFTLTIFSIQSKDMIPRQWNTQPDPKKQWYASGLLEHLNSKSYSYGWHDICCWLLIYKFPNNLVTYLLPFHCWLCFVKCWVLSFGMTKKKKCLESS